MYFGDALKNSRYHCGANHYFDRLFYMLRYLLNVITQNILHAQIFGCSRLLKGHIDMGGRPQHVVTRILFLMSGQK